MVSAKLAAFTFTLALSSWAPCQTWLAERAPVSNLFSFPAYTPSEAIPATFIAASPDTTAPSLEDPYESIFRRKPKPRSNELEEDAPKKPRKKNKDKLQVHPFSTFAIGIKAGTLGAGAEIATPLTRSLNLRASANFVAFRYSFNIDGISYFTRIDYRSGVLNVDWFPFHGGFHISPGIMYFNTGLSGAAKVSPGKPFTLDSTHYIDSIDDPVSGLASVSYKQHFAPTLTVGFTNIIARTGKHLSVPFEAGLAYTRAPVMNVTLAGTACTIQGCFNAATDSGTQANLKGELTDINETVSKVTVYPIMSLGIALRF